MRDGGGWCFVPVPPEGLPPMRDAGGWCFVPTLPEGLPSMRDGGVWCFVSIPPEGLPPMRGGGGWRFVPKPPEGLPATRDGAGWCFVPTTFEGLPATRGGGGWCFVPIPPEGYDGPTPLPPPVEALPLGATRASINLGSALARPPRWSPPHEDLHSPIGRASARGEIGNTLRGSGGVGGRTRELETPRCKCMPNRPRRSGLLSPSSSAFSLSPVMASPRSSSPSSSPSSLSSSLAHSAFFSKQALMMLSFLSRKPLLSSLAFCSLSQYVVRVVVPRYAPPCARYFALYSSVES